MTAENILSLIPGYIFASGSAALAQFMILFGPLLILTFLLNALARSIGRTCIGLLKPSLFLLTLGWLGTTVHELGHVVFALLFFRKIKEVKWFSLDPWNPVQGYVLYERKGNLLQKFGDFFIGLGPLLVGAVIIYIAAWGLLGSGTFAGMDQTPLTGDTFTLRTVGLLIQRIFNSAGAALRGVFTGANHTPAAVFAFLYVTLSISSAMTLSTADIFIVRSGFVVLLIGIFLFNMVTFWSGNYIDLFIGWIAPYYDMFYGVLIFGLIITSVLWLLLLPVSVLVSDNRAFRKS